MCFNFLPIHFPKTFIIVDIKRAKLNPTDRTTKYHMPLIFILNKYRRHFNSIQATFFSVSRTSIDLDYFQLTLEFSEIELYID